MENWLPWSAAPASVLLAAGCSLAIDTDQVQCQLAADCAALGFPNLECVDSICTEPETTPFSCRTTEWPALTTETVEAKVVARSLSVGAPVPDLTIKVCNTLVDPACASPTGEAMTDAEGVWTFDVFEGFRGHLFAPSVSEDQAPYLLHMNPPPNPELPHTLQSSLTITNLATIRGIAELAERPFVEQRGHLFFSTRGCDGQILSGVRVSVVDPPEDMVLTYLGTNGLPDESLENTGTGSYGRGAIINLEPGFVTVRGFHDDVGKIFEQVLLLAEDTITSTSIVPSPY